MKTRNQQKKSKNILIINTKCERHAGNGGKNDVNARYGPIVVS